MNRFILQPYTGIKSRMHCPQCRHRSRTFKRYIDMETGLPVADHVGRCDREESCGYHYKPGEYFKTVPNYQRQPNVAWLAAPVKKPVFNTLPWALVRDGLKAYPKNNFVCFLVGMFGHAKAMELAAQYHIGTSKHWPGATIFWQVDIKGQVRTGKIMLYNKDTCKRVKEPYNHIAWVHSLLSRGSPKVGKTESRGSPESPESRESPKVAASLGGGEGTSFVQSPQNHLSDFRISGLSDSYSLQQCFFGEHLLPLNPQATVCIVESEKTAIIAAAVMPGPIWLAAGSLNGLNTDKCQALKNRTVILFPDVNGHDKWKARAADLNLRIPSATFGVSEALRLTATPEEMEKGIDLADRWV